MNNPWVLTQSGIKFDLLDPTPEMVSIDDIAHALANSARWTGHTARFYSVAEHSIHVSGLVAHDLRLAALLHDAAEAYVGDVSSPLKPLLTEYKTIELRIMEAVAWKFGIEETLWDSASVDPIINRDIKKADNIMLATEWRDLMPQCDEPVATDEKPLENFYLTAIWEPQVARAAFLHKFKELT